MRMLSHDVLTDGRRVADRLARMGARYGASLILFNAALQKGKGR